MKSKRHSSIVLPCELPHMSWCALASAPIITGRFRLFAISTASRTFDDSLSWVIWLETIKIWPVSVSQATTLLLCQECFEDISYGSQMSIISTKCLLSTVNPAKSLTYAYMLKATRAPVLKTPNKSNCNQIYQPESKEQNLSLTLVVLKQFLASCSGMKLSNYNSLYCRRNLTNCELFKNIFLDRQRYKPNKMKYNISQ